jgi:hypothetical protein
MMAFIGVFSWVWCGGIVLDLGGEANEGRRGVGRSAGWRFGRREVGVVEWGER